MTRRGYDDGDGRWDVSVRCDQCGLGDWEPLLDGWTRISDDPEYPDTYDDEDMDYCPLCSIAMRLNREAIQNHDDIPK